MLCFLVPCVGDVKKTTKQTESTSQPTVNQYNTASSFPGISHQLFGTDEHHLLVRTSLVRYELSNQQCFQAYVFTNQDISSHAIQMSTPGI